MPSRLLGMIYGVHPSTISYTVSGKLWKHLPLVVEEPNHGEMPME